MDRVVLFFADGEPIFSLILSTEVTGEPGIFAADSVSFRNIAVSEGVRLSVSTSDGAGQKRQSQSLDGEASVVREIVYDGEGRGAVTTKPARLAPTVGEPLLTYRAGIVASIDWASGVMTGEASRYYSREGQGPSDDGGYPYSRDRYEASPLGRVVEKGRPGEDFAERHTTKITYRTGP